MRAFHLAGCMFLLASIGAVAGTGPTTQATTAPAGVNAEQTLSRMLKPTVPVARPLQPVSEVPMTDNTSGTGAVAPKAPTVKLVREGTYIVDRIGRLRKMDDGQRSELVFEADGAAMQDPPMIILPNLTLMQMENAAGQGKRFRVTGMVTEYRGRNCVLLDKAVPVIDVVR